jgi:hypothetical protein
MIKKCVITTPDGKKYRSKTLADEHLKKLKPPTPFNKYHILRYINEEATRKELQTITEWITERLKDFDS